jgi:hypothetical protein
MSHPVEALPEDIARLLEREKGAYAVDPDVRRALLSRVEMAIALGGADLPAGGPSSPPGAAGSGEVVASAVKKGVAGKMVAVAVAAFVGGGITGGAVVETMTRTRTLAPIVAPMPPVTSSAVAPPAPGQIARANSSSPSESAPVPESRASASSPPEPVAPLPPARPNVASSSSGTPSSHGDLVREREILDAARAALARGQAQDAIAAMEEHARRWPNGELAAEREVVLIQALVAAGRLPEARARAARFHQAFPKSIFAPAIDIAIGAAPAPP